LQQILKNFLNEREEEKEEKKELISQAIKY